MYTRRTILGSIAVGIAALKYTDGQTQGVDPNNLVMPSDKKFHFQSINQKSAFIKYIRDDLRGKGLRGNFWLASPKDGNYRESDFHHQTLFYIEKKSISTQNVLIKLYGNPLPEKGIAASSAIDAPEQGKVAIYGNPIELEIVRGLSGPVYAKLSVDKSHFEIKDKYPHQINSKEESEYKTDGFQITQTFSFRVANFPDMYLRHHTMQLMFGSYQHGSSLFNEDASFVLVEEHKMLSIQP